MQNLPTAEVYEKEFRYMPWGILIEELLATLESSLPQNARVLDLLCGTGYLLAKLKDRRPDLEATGVDLEAEFIAFAARTYPGITFITADAATWESSTPFDAILCTGGLHHLPYETQETFIKRLRALLSSNGVAIVADPYIDDYRNEGERKLAAAKLGYEYLAATIRNGADDDVIKATASLIANDVLAVEYKSSVAKIEPLFRAHFSSVEKKKTWPAADTEYGDYYFTLRA